jgi:hypothetical protein
MERSIRRQLLEMRKRRELQKLRRGKRLMDWHVVLDSQQLRQDLEAQVRSSCRRWSGGGSGIATILQTSCVSCGI